MDNDLANYRVMTDCIESIMRASRAYNYMMSTLDGNQIYEMHCDIESIYKYYTVVGLSAQSVAEDFVRCRWDIDDVEHALANGTFPKELYNDILAYADRAACAVAYKYEFYYYDTLTDWGCELIDEYAADDDYQWPGQLGLCALLVEQNQEKRS